jgi:hypothetical protein
MDHHERRGEDRKASVHMKTKVWRHSNVTLNQKDLAPSLSWKEGRAGRPRSEVKARSSW